MTTPKQSAALRRALSAESFTNEGELTRACMVVAGETMPDVMILRNSVGTMQNAAGQHHAFGLGKGTPDLIIAVTMKLGVMGVKMSHEPTGVIYNPIRDLARFAAIEMKQPGRVSDPHQVQCHDAWRRRGIFVAECHSVQEFIDAIERCRRGDLR